MHHVWNSWKLREIYRAHFIPSGLSVLFAVTPEMIQSFLDLPELFVFGEKWVGGSRLGKWEIANMVSRNCEVELNNRYSAFVMCLRVYNNKQT